jgi:hypothetical protein
VVTAVDEVDKPQPGGAAAATFCPSYDAGAARIKIAVQLTAAVGHLNLDRLTENCQQLFRIRSVLAHNVSDPNTLERRVGLFSNLGELL